MDSYLTHLGTFGLGLAISSLAWTILVNHETKAWKRLCVQSNDLLNDYADMQKQNIIEYVRLAAWTSLLAEKLKEAGIEHISFPEFVKRFHTAEVEANDDTT